jgi:hypothetical protein
MTSLKISLRSISKDGEILGTKNTSTWVGWLIIAVLWEAEAGRKIMSSRQLGLHSETLSQKKKKKKERKKKKSICQQSERERKEKGDYCEGEGSIGAQFSCSSKCSPDYLH